MSYSGNPESAGTAMGSDDAAGLYPSDIPEAVLLRVVFHLGHDFFIQTERMDEVQLVVVNCVSLQVVIKKIDNDAAHLAAVFFCGNQFAVDQFNRRFYLQERCA